MTSSGGDSRVHDKKRKIIVFQRFFKMSRIAPATTPKLYISIHLFSQGSLHLSRDHQRATCLTQKMCQSN